MQQEAVKIEGSVLRDWMVNYICTVLSLSRDTFQTSERFDRLGFDSVEAVIMAGLMEEEFGIQIDPMLLFEHPSVDEFTAYLSRSTSGG